MDEVVRGQVRILRKALEQLSLEPEEQFAALRGAVVADELALDFDNAFRLLPALQAAGIDIDADTNRRLGRLNEHLSGVTTWDDRALWEAAEWSEARNLARDILAGLPAELREIK